MQNWLIRKLAHILPMMGLNFMNQQSEDEAQVDEVNSAFHEKAYAAFTDLFSRAKVINEVAFAFALSPELRGMQDAGWNTAHESYRAKDEYIRFLKSTRDPIKTRVSLALYCHIAESGGFYEIPKNMMGLCSGDNYNTMPFRDLVRYTDRGNVIAPNANKIIKSLIGHAEELGLTQMSEVFRDAFDADVRNGFSHADYIIWQDGLRLRWRNGGNPRIVPWADYENLLNKGLGFIETLQRVVSDCMGMYRTPVTLRGRLNHGEPETDWTIHSDASAGTFTITSR